MEMKRLGSEHNLANVFVDLSTSRAALLPVCLAELQIEAILACDPSEQIIHEYLAKNLKETFPNFKEEDMENFIENYIADIGIRF